jgi:hypothetical protein
MKMAKQAFSVTGAIAMQTQAREAFERSEAAGTTYKVLCNGAPYVTLASYAAAVAFVGKSKRLTIVKG